MRRCFELIDGHHGKFWTVEVAGVHYLATFGRMGTVGQTQAKSFKTSKEATEKACDMMQQKKNKGYIEVFSTKHPGASKELIASLSGLASLAPAKTRKVADMTTKPTRAIMVDD